MTITDGGYIHFTADTLTELGLKSVPKLPPHSITVTCIGNLGKIGITSTESATNQQINSVVPSRHLNYKFLYHYLATLKPWLEQEASATTVAIINKGKFSKAPIKVAPLAEQHQIAAKLDELLAQVDSIKSRLDAIPNILKRFRQSVLAAAVSGKLTEDCRTKYTSEKNWLFDLPEDQKTRRGLPETVPLNDEIAARSFPEGWGVYSLASLLRKGAIIDLKDGNHGVNHPKSAEFTSEGLPFITAADLNDAGHIDFENSPKVSGEPLSKLKVGFSKAGDVIYSHKGTVGRVAITDRDCVLSPQTTYIRLNSMYINNSYYALMLKSNVFTSQVNAIKSQTTRDFVPITAQYSLFVVLPSLDEQTEIAHHVEQLFAYADQIEQRVKDAQSRVNHLTQAILAKAFRGELTVDWRTQNPDLVSGINSAEALLERIQLERTTVSTKSKTPKVKKKSSEAMTPKQIIPVYEALRTAGRALSGQELLASAGYSSDASTQQLEQFFLDIRQQLELKTITRNRRENSDQDWFEVTVPKG